jgi:hypothetical protein
VFGGGVEGDDFVALFVFKAAAEVIYDFRGVVQ